MPLSTVRCRGCFILFTINRVFLGYPVGKTRVLDGTQWAPFSPDLRDSCRISQPLVSTEICEFLVNFNTSRHPKSRHVHKGTRGLVSAYCRSVKTCKEALLYVREVKQFLQKIGQKSLYFFFYKKKKMGKWLELPGFVPRCIYIYCV